VSVFRFEDEVFLDAPPGRVFDALTFNISAWWGAPYLLLHDTTNVAVEGQLGGRFFEESGHHQGVIRGTVTAIRQDACLELTGSIGDAGVLPGVVRFDLDRREGGTLLRLVHAGLTDRPGQAEAFRGMWADLLKGRLKPFVER
jgi:uncharacterized protein YndB with AHSA1/START domain